MPSAQPKLSSEAITIRENLFAVLDPVALDAADVSAQRDPLPEFNDAASQWKLLEDTRRQE